MDVLSSQDQPVSNECVAAKKNAINKPIRNTYLKEMKA